MTRSLVAMLSFLSASTLLARPAVQVQNNTPSFRKLMKSTLRNGSPPAQPTAPDDISPSNDYVLIEKASLMPALADMHNPSAEKRAIMHEERDPSLDNYADFRKAEAEGWHDVLRNLIFNKNVDPQKLYKWALTQGDWWSKDMPPTVPSTIRVIVDHATDLQIDLTANQDLALVWAV